MRTLTNKKYFVIWFCFWIMALELAFAALVLLRGTVWAGTLLIAKDDGILVLVGAFVALVFAFVLAVLMLTAKKG